MEEQTEMKLLGGGRLRSFSLLFTDLFSLALSLGTVFYFCGVLKTGFLLKTWPLFILLAVFNISGRLYCGNIIYPGLVIHPVEELRRLTLSCLGTFITGFAIISFAGGSNRHLQIPIFLSMLLCIILLPLGRIVLRYLLWLSGRGYIPALISGDPELARVIAARIKEDNYSILKLRGSCCGEEIAPEIPDQSVDEMVELAKSKRINYLIYCNRKEEYREDVINLLPEFLHVLVVNQDARFPVLWSYPVSFYRYFSFEISNRMKRQWVIWQKQILEVLLAFAGVILAFIPGVLLALAVRLSGKGPIFYRARRLGKNGKSITVLKFRTMYPDADRKLKELLDQNPELKAEWQKNFKLENDPRITPIGRFLRKTSLDELPQFWNVLKGEMALIGPRPIVPEEVKYYGKDYKIFSSVKPGITGLWQVSGRSNTDYEERVALDVFYIHNWSIWMDYYIFLATFNAVIFRRGAK